LEEIEVSDKYKLWADECSKMFDGLDILAVDAIHTKDGKEYILEMNDGSIGLAPEREEEDHRVIRDLVMRRLKEAYPPKQQPKMN
jgi:glutathione synthase/RimK-type ligase-like ATP-grasp enzyme